RTKDGKEEKCIGSVEELRTEIEKAKEAGLLNADFDTTKATADLHRPYVDDIILVSTQGEAMYREPDLIDVWFDSGAMPYAQWHYPFENKEIFEQSYPADFIAEGVDQTRGWFFTLHAIAAMLNDCADDVKAINKKVNNPGIAFKNVISNGLVLDKNGNKMSKSKGNVVNPFEAINTYGPDVVRWYMIENAPPWDNLKFDFEGIKEVQRRFFGTLLNTYSFFALYANIDGFAMDEQKQIPVKDRAEADRWIISKLQTLITEVESAYNEFEPTRAARAIQDFVDYQLSNWYVRLNRKRFWRASKDNISDDKQAAYETLYECLLVTSQLMAPIAPFFAEWLYKNLSDNIRKDAKENKTSLQFDSVHHSYWKGATFELIDKALEERMEYAQTICSLVHAIRKNHKIKVRTPLQRILLPVINPEFSIQVKQVEEIILAEVNVKSIEYIDDASGVVVKKAKPNFKKLGKQYGAKMKEVAALIAAFDQAEIKTLESTGKLTKASYDFELADAEIVSEDIPGWAVANDGALTVALDINVSDELKKEGIARDFVNRVQNLRKELLLEVTDKIKIRVSKSDEFVNASLQAFEAYICTETQAISLNIADGLQEGKEVEMDEFTLRIDIQTA
ncbi:MAG TPA: DUF5915 domain-containing protein, partial [Cyclobacteriaceae bacterium]|nr:DUF5915 domain-containing protein [Cyclobacteriaceae bacterium]